MSTCKNYQEFNELNAAGKLISLNAHKKEVFIEIDQ